MTRATAITRKFNERKRTQKAGAPWMGPVVVDISNRRGVAVRPLIRAKGTKPGWGLGSDVVLSFMRVAEGDPKKRRRARRTHVVCRVERFHPLVINGATYTGGIWFLRDKAGKCEYQLSLPALPEGMPNHDCFTFKAEAAGVDPGGGGAERAGGGVPGVRGVQEGGGGAVQRVLSEVGTGAAEKGEQPGGRGELAGDARGVACAGAD